MFGGSTSPGEIAGIVIIAIVFLILGVFVCGCCGPLPEPSEIGAQRWRERKARTAARRAERQRQREMELPLHRTTSRARNRTIAFADEQAPPPPTTDAPMPSPPPPAATRNRSPSPKFSSSAPENDVSSVTSRNSSASEDRDASTIKGDEKGLQQDGCGSSLGDKPQSASSILVSDKDAASSTLSVPPPVYSDAVKKESLSL